MMHFVRRLNMKVPGTPDAFIHMQKALVDKMERLLKENMTS